MMDEKMKWIMSKNADDKFYKMCPILTQAFGEYHSCVTIDCEWYIANSWERRYNRVCAITTLAMNSNDQGVNFV